MKSSEETVNDPNDDWANRMKITVASLVASFVARSAFAGSITSLLSEPELAQALDRLAVISASNGSTSAEIDVDSVGLHAGYLHDLGTFVVGGELSFNSVSADDDGDTDVIRLRGRFSYDLGRFMPYVTLGAAHASGDSISESGISYGFGAEYRVTEKFNLGLEYSRTTFNDIDNIDGLDLDLDLTQIRGSYRF
jgi:opacity protein-like surface antigen